MIAQAIASRKILQGSLLAVFTLILTFSWEGSGVVGFAPWVRSWSGYPSVPGKRINSFCSRMVSGNLKYVLLMVILFSAIFTNLTLLFLDPLTIGYMNLTMVIWPVWIISLHFLTAIDPGAIFIKVVGGFDSLIRPSIFPADPAFYRMAFCTLDFF